MRDIVFKAIYAESGCVFSASREFVIMLLYHILYIRDSNISMDVSLTAYVGVLLRFIKLQLVRSILDIFDALREIAKDYNHDVPFKRLALPPNLTYLVLPRSCCRQ